jgi:hypothetical protein
MHMSIHQSANALIGETSPYLKQHAYNPVQWYPWREDALELAKKQDKPIILSIGYSACHWCHVMERESFEDQEIADIMNAHFVSIKVDREERPDIDQIYMEAIQAMGLNGGWPLNVILLPDLRPFYGGTYFPPQKWENLLLQIARAYKEHRKELEESAGKFHEVLGVDEAQKYGLHVNDNPFDAQIMEEGIRRLESNFDKEYGGLEKAPKFPMPANWDFLLDYLFFNPEDNRKNQVIFTLDQMASGGIYDQAGGGFARYSVDRYWFAPHFEKMLYDNGQLMALYARGFRMTKKSLYRRIIEQTYDWIKREMISPEGAFYSALDADSEGEEGKFYTWTATELCDELKEDYTWFAGIYGIQDSGNWENGRNILHRHKSDTAISEEFGMDINDIPKKLHEVHQKLLEVRSGRVHPGLDDKLLSGWNGLMISGLCEAYMALQKEAFLDTALKAAEFILHHLYDENGKLKRLYSQQNQSIPAFLEDYAAVIHAYIDLYQVTFDEKWLLRARELAEIVMSDFQDDQSPLFFYAPAGDSSLIARKKEIFDNVIPSSNAIMAANLYLLGTLLDLPDYIDRSRNMASSMQAYIKQDVNYTSYWARTYLMHVDGIRQVVIAGDEAIPWARQLMQDLWVNTLFIPVGEKSMIPLTQNKTPRDGQTTGYVCVDRTCKRPVHSWEDIRLEIENSFA